jgi:release factor glutamine methyltransferase
VTRSELVAELTATLGARHEARFIVEDVLGVGPTSSGASVGPAEVDRIRALAARRGSGEPLQYVLGHWAFRSLDLLVDPRVLIPRPETEQVVEVALREIAHLGATGPVIVDAGTGSGAIALSLATELAHSNPEGRVWAVDCSPDALAVARSNLERVRRRDDGPMLPVTMVQGSWLSALPAAMEGRITLVVSNPPYIEPTQWTGLQAEVRYEPAGALLAAAGTDGTPGLGEVEAVLRQAWGWLSRPGAAVIEVAPDQASAAVGMAESIGYLDVHAVADLAGRSRALGGRVR